MVFSLYLLKVRIVPNFKMKCSDIMNVNQILILIFSYSFVCDNCLKKAGKTRKENKFSSKSKYFYILGGVHNFWSSDEQNDWPYLCLFPSEKCGLILQGWNPHPYLHNWVLQHIPWPALFHPHTFEIIYSSNRELTLSHPFRLQWTPQIRPD